MPTEVDDRPPIHPPPSILHPPIHPSNIHPPSSIHPSILYTSTSPLTHLFTSHPSMCQALCNDHHRPGPHGDGEPDAQVPLGVGEGRVNPSKWCGNQVEPPVFLLKPPQWDVPSPTGMKTGLFLAEGESLAQEPGGPASPSREEVGRFLSEDPAREVTGPPRCQRRAGPMP